MHLWNFHCIEALPRVPQQVSEQLQWIFEYQRESSAQETTVSPSLVLVKKPRFSESELLWTFGESYFVFGPCSPISELGMTAKDWEDHQDWKLSHAVSSHVWGFGPLPFRM